MQYKTLKFRTIAESRHMFDILILGSYQPEDQKILLEKLRDHLRSIGFSNTFIVKDFSDKDFRNDRDKSYYLLHNCDCALFIITREGEKMGITSELEEFFREVKGIRAALFEEQFSSDGKIISAASSMVRRIISSEKLRALKFSDQDELFIGVESTANSLFYETISIEPERLNRLSIPIKPLCQNCSVKNSELRCLNFDCNVYHLCKNCVKLRNKKSTCPTCSSVVYSVAWDLGI